MGRIQITIYISIKRNRYIVSFLIIYHAIIVKYYVVLLSHSSHIWLCNRVHGWERFKKKKWGSEK